MARALVFALATLVATWRFSAIAQHHVPTRLHPNIQALFRLTIMLAFWLLGGSICLGLFGLTLAPLVATVGVTVVLASWSGTIIQAVASGVWILLEDRIRVGDDIDIPELGVTGMVADVRVRVVDVVLPDGHHKLVPSIRLFSAVVTVPGE